VPRAALLAHLMVQPWPLDLRPRVVLFHLGARTDAHARPARVLGRTDTRATPAVATRADAHAWPARIVGRTSTRPTPLHVPRERME
jgi:hypothetical protein